MCSLDLGNRVIAVSAIVLKRSVSLLIAASSSRRFLKSAKSGPSTPFVPCPQLLSKGAKRPFPGCEAATSLMAWWVPLHVFEGHAQSSVAQEGRMSKPLGCFSRYVFTRSFLLVGCDGWRVSLVTNYVRGTRFDSESRQRYRHLHLDSPQPTLVLRLIVVNWTFW